MIWMMMFLLSLFAGIGERELTLQWDLGMSR